MQLSYIRLITLGKLTQIVAGCLLGLGLNLSFQIKAEPYTIDKEPTLFLTKQLKRALLQKDDPLAKNALDKLIQISPHQAPTYCAKIRYQVANNQLTLARQTLAQLKKLKKLIHVRPQPKF